MNDTELIAVTTKTVVSSYRLKKGQWSRRCLSLATEETYERMAVGHAHSTDTQRQFRVSRPGPFDGDCCLLETKSVITAQTFVEALSRTMDDLIVDVRHVVRSYLRITNSHVRTTNPLVD